MSNTPNFMELILAVGAAQSQEQFNEALQVLKNALSTQEHNQSFAEAMATLQQQCNEHAASGQLEKYGLPILSFYFVVDAFGFESAKFTAAFNLCALGIATGQLDLALTAGEEASDAANRNAVHPLSEASLYGNLGIIYRVKGELDTALDFQNKAREIQEVQAPNSLTLASTYGNLGIIYKVQGELNTALDFQNKAREIFEVQAPNSLTLASTYGNLGNIYQEKGELDTALEFQNKAREIEEVQAPNSLTLAGTYGNLGNIYQAKGELDTALGFQNKAREIQEVQAPNSLTLAGTYGNLGNIYQVKGELDTALDFQNKAKEIFEVQAPNSLTLASSYGNLGIIYKVKGELNTALDFQNKAREIEEVQAPNSLTLASTYGNLGNIYQGKGELDTALDFQNKAREIEEVQAPNSLTLASTYGNLGIIYQDKGELDTALDFLNKALALQMSLAPGIEDRLVVERATLQTERLKSGSPSLESLRRALSAVVTVVGMRSGFDALRIANENAWIASELATELDKDDKPTEAYTVRETMKSLTLKLRLAKHQRQDELEQLRGEIQKMNAQAEDLNRLANDPDSSEDVRNGFQTHFDQMVKDRDAKLQELLELDNAIYGVPEMTPTAIHTTVGNGTLVLEYDVSEEQTRLDAFFRGEHRSLVIQTGDEQLGTEKWLDLLPTAAGQSDDYERIADWFISRLQDVEKVADLLFTQVTDWIKKCDRILVSGSGPLAMVPFAALWVDLGEERVQLNDHALVANLVSPGAFSVAKKQAERTRTGKPLVVGIDPPENDMTKMLLTALDDEAKRLAPTTPATRKFSRIPNAPHEAVKIGDLLGEAALTQENATSRNILALFPEASSIHLATHSFFFPDLPFLSSILTYPENKEDSGLILVSQIEALQLKAKLVVLSSCQSGQAGNLNASELVGTAYAMLKSGVPTVIASLWSVGDQSTHDFMVKMYEHLAKGATAGDALRETRKWFQASYPNLGEAAWAAFVLFGDPDVTIAG